jgi:hypothetical protein
MQNTNQFQKSTVHPVKYPTGNYPINYGAEGLSGTIAPAGNKFNGVNFGHLGLIVSVAILLLGVSWMKNPNLFDAFKSGNSNSIIASNIPRYYAYETPAEFTQPIVAGASTELNGPMVINEDGTLSPAIDEGMVLGFDTGGVVLDTETVKVNKIADSAENIAAYVKAIEEIENGYLNSVQFEAALVSSNQVQIDEQAQNILEIANNIVKLSVPSPLVKLHQAKVIQYRSAYEILKNFTNADSNPELLNLHLSLFLKAEQEMSDEIQRLGEKLNVIEPSLPNE